MAKKNAKKSFIIDPTDKEFSTGQQFDLEIESVEWQEKQMDWDDEPKDYLHIVGSTEFTDEYNIDIKYSKSKNSYFFNFITALQDEAGVDMKDLDIEKDLEGQTVTIERRDLTFGTNKQTGQDYKKEGACLIVGVKGE